MRFGLRKPSLRKALSARFSIKRKIKNALHLRVPKGVGIFTHPKKSLYNKVYNKTTFSGFSFLKSLYNKERHLKTSSSKASNSVSAFCSLLFIIPTTLSLVISKIFIWSYKIFTCLVVRSAKSVCKLIFRKKNKTQF